MIPPLSESVGIEDDTGLCLEVGGGVVVISSLAEDAIMTRKRGRRNEN